MAALYGSLIGCGVDAKLTELSGTWEDNIIQATQAEFDFSLISFYKPSDPASVVMNKLLDGAKFVFDKKIKENTYTARRVGWFQIDVESHPELSMF